MNGVKMSNRRNRKGSPAERYFVWFVGVISYALAFFWIESKVPFSNCSVLVQWGCIAFSLGFGVLGVCVGYVAVTNGRR